MNECPVLHEGWSWTTLNQVIIQYRLGSRVRGAGGKRVFLVRPRNIVNGSVDSTNLTEVVVSSADQKEAILKHGEVLVTWANSYNVVGKAGLYQGKGEVICSSSIIRLQVDERLVCPGYLSLWLNSETVKKFLIRMNPKGIGATKMNIKRYVKFCPILMPSLEKQLYISRIQSTWNIMLSLLQKQVDILKKQKKNAMELILKDFPASERSRLR